MKVELTVRNGVAPTAEFGVITGAMEYLSEVYVDLHHAEMDELQAQADQIRKDALEDSRTEWDDIEMAGIVARLIAAIESAEDDRYIQWLVRLHVTPDADTWTALGPDTESRKAGAYAKDDSGEYVTRWETTPAIEELRESLIYTTAVDKALPLSQCMARAGARHRLTAITRKVRRHGTLQSLWRLASVVTITSKVDGGLATYFDQGVPEWPRIAGSDDQSVTAMRRRVELLELLDRKDTIALMKAQVEHVRARSALSESEVKN